MMSSIFALLLVPVFPELADPQTTHGSALAALEGKLTEARTGPPGGAKATAVNAVEKDLALQPPVLPAITGRIFAWSAKGFGEQLQQEGDLGMVAESLRLTGLIESSGQRVAIVNDGQKDHVLGQGSYLRNLYQVVSVGQGSVVLLPVSPVAGLKRIELNLVP